MSNLLDVCAAEGIQVKSKPSKEACAFTEDLKNGGIAFQLRGEKLIVLNEALDGWEKLLVLAHETAHHIFGHLDKLENGKLPAALEDEARLFSVVYTALCMFSSREAVTEH